MADKYIIFSLDDEKSKALGEAISSPSCKKIVNFLAEKEASASEISKELGMPLNSVDYNIKKLIGAGIIEKAKGFLWSIKGKKIENYKVVNKVIVISPKKGDVYSKLRGIVPVVIISAILTAVLGWYYNMINANIAAKSAESVQTPLLAALPGQAGATANVMHISPWIFFAFGGLAAIILFLIWNWKKL